MSHDQPIGYQIFERRVVLRGRLALLSSLHIGAGRAIGGAATDLPVLRDVQDRPFIPGSSPGSSLKGVLRSNLESFLRAFQGKARSYLACCPVGRDASAAERTRRPCIGDDHKDDHKKELLLAPDGDARIWEESCWICRAFGSPWLASKVQIIDLPVATAWTPELFLVRDGVAIDRESETAASKLKFDFEVVPPGTEFAVEILLENPEDHELGNADAGDRPAQRSPGPPGGIYLAGAGPGAAGDRGVGRGDPSGDPGAAASRPGRAGRSFFGLPLSRGRRHDQRPR